MSDVSKGQRSGVNIEDFERKLYASSDTGRAANDPLDELSRIIGKTDPFGSVFASSASASGARAPSRPQGQVAPLTQAAAPRVNAVPAPVRPAFSDLPGSSGIPVGTGLGERSDSSPRPPFSVRNEPSFPAPPPAAPNNDQTFGPNFLTKLIQPR